MKTPFVRSKQHSIFSTFVRKEFYHILRDKTTLSILIILPILMLILFGYAITTEVRNTHIAIYSPTQDAVTRALIEKFKASEYFSEVKMLNSHREIKEQFNRGEVKMVVLITAHLEEKMNHSGNAQISLLTDATDPNTAKSIVSYASNIIASQFQDTPKSALIPTNQINPQVKLLYNPQMKGAYNFVPGVMGMIMLLICAMMTSIAIAREKELGTMEILLVSPMKPIYIIIAKAIPYFFISIINLITILCLSVFLLGVPIKGDLTTLLFISLVYIFVNLSIGLFISSIVNTQLVALLISGMVLMFPVIMLSGMMFPIENIPIFMQKLSHIIPAKWYIMAVKKIMIKGLGLTSILKELAILSTMGGIFIFASLKNFKHRLE